MSKKMKLVYPIPEGLRRDERNLLLVEICKLAFEIFGSRPDESHVVIDKVNITVTLSLTKSE